MTESFSVLNVYNEPTTYHCIIILQIIVHAVISLNFDDSFNNDYK